MSESLFQPIVTVTDDGTISVDWFDSYVNTVTDDDRMVYDQPEGDPHSTLLDTVLGRVTVDPVTMKQTSGPSEADRLRRLADYIDGKLELPG